MTLIKSISGIRGTIGGVQGEGLTPPDIVRITAAYMLWVRQHIKREGRPLKPKIIVGRDARISGPMVQHLVTGTLLSMGANVYDVGLAATPTVEMAVTGEYAHGGIIITASHNPEQWNAMKLLDSNGEFLDDKNGKLVLSLADQIDSCIYSGIGNMGHLVEKDALSLHIKCILALPLVDVEAIKARKFRVAIDCVNSVGGRSLPRLLHALGVADIIYLHCKSTGKFPHNPEPLPENLTELAEVTAAQGADVGFAVDPDVDRLAIISEDGSIPGEEYTLVAVADYVLRHTPGGNTASNLSSSRALRDVTQMHGGQYAAAAVGEVNVVTAMKANQSVIGGEGNGGVIYPELHYGRDSLVGIALFLSHLAQQGTTCSKLMAQYPAYFMCKKKMELDDRVDLDALLHHMKKRYRHERVTGIDGLKIDFADEWVHMRKSNTEPIIRIYTESATSERASQLAKQMMIELRDASKDFIVAAPKCPRGRPRKNA